MTTVKTQGLEVRRANDLDNLVGLIDLGRHALNREHVLVAVSARPCLEGMLVLFDSGHSVVYADHLITRADAPLETGPRLLLAVDQYCRERGKTAIFAVSGNLDLAYIGKRRGAHVEGPLFRIRYDVEGATHA